MKLVYLLCCLLLNPIISATQTLGTIADSNSVLKSYYGGILHRQAYELPRWHKVWQTGVRVAAVTKKDINIDDVNFGTLHFKVAYDFPGTASHLYWKKYFGNTSLTIGTPPRPISIQKPTPFSANGQFMSNSQGQIPGVSNGGFIEHLNNKGFGIQYGLFQSPDNNLEFDWGLVQKYQTSELRFGWYSNVQASGCAISLMSPDLEFTVFGQTDSIFSAFINVPMVYGKMFFDYIFNEHQDRTSWSEIGWTTEFTTSGITTLLGTGYRYPANELAVYLFVHI